MPMASDIQRIYLYDISTNYVSIHFCQTENPAMQKFMIHFMIQYCFKFITSCQEFIMMIMIK